MKKIRNLNNLQLCHFLRSIRGNIQLVSLALDRASNPEIYSSDGADNTFNCIGTPAKNREYYESTLYWFDCLDKHDFDEDMADIFKNDQGTRDAIRGWSDKTEEK